MPQPATKVADNVITWPGDCRSRDSATSRRFPKTLKTSGSPTRISVCDTPDEKRSERDMDHGVGDVDALPVVPHQPTPVHEPAEGPFHHPAPGSACSRNAVRLIVGGFQRQIALLTPASRASASARRRFVAQARITRGWTSLPRRASSRASAVALRQPSLHRCRR
jgi:hypothetical protein